MDSFDWAKEFNASVTICNREGIVVYMNGRSIAQFKNYGGESLVGNSLVDCHPEPSRTKLLQMLENPIENIYTTEKAGKKNIIIQKPWMQDGQFSGVVEISFELPADMLNHKR